MSGGRVLWPGETVEEGEGPVHCSHQGEDGLCASFLGAPPAGSTLLTVTEPGFRLEACEPEVAAWRCPSCGAVTIFRTEVATRSRSG